MQNFFGIGVARAEKLKSLINRQIVPDSCICCFSYLTPIVAQKVHGYQISAVKSVPKEVVTIPMQRVCLEG